MMEVMIDLLNESEDEKYREERSGMIYAGAYHDGLDTSRQREREPEAELLRACRYSGFDFSVVLLQEASLC